MSHPRLHGTVIGKCKWSGERIAMYADIESRQVIEPCNGMRKRWEYKCPDCNRWVGETQHGNFAFHKRHGK